MLKNNKFNIQLDDNIKDYLFDVLDALDCSINTNYKMIFYYIYIYENLISLEKMAECCYVSMHKLRNDIQIVSLLVENFKCKCLKYLKI